VTLIVHRCTSFLPYVGERWVEERGGEEEEGEDPCELREKDLLDKFFVICYNTVFINK
jgi:hypothetical protein